jgi:hypothetical protein
MNFVTTDASSFHPIEVQARRCKTSGGTSAACGVLEKLNYIYFKSLDTGREKRGPGNDGDS